MQKNLRLRLEYHQYDWLHSEKSVIFAKNVPYTLVNIYRQLHAFTYTYRKLHAFADNYTHLQTRDKVEKIANICTDLYTIFPG